MNDPLPPEPDPSDSEKRSPPDGSASPFIVGIGASAGGLQAFTEFLAGLPADGPMSFVLIQHLNRAHPSELAELLRRSSPLPVVWLHEATKPQAGAVYVLPPGHQLTVVEGVLRPEPGPAEPTPTIIDRFLRSLAIDYKERAIGVILSGTGTDGALGLRAIKDAGGLSFVQDRASALFNGMPRAALGEGFTDFVLPPARIAEELVRLTQQSARLWNPLSPTPDENADPENLAALFRVLNARTGVDFSDYKQSTIMRRVVRRMALTRSESLADYVKLLYKSREEVAALHEGMLINVTEFFRDQEYFDYLGGQVLPEILQHHDDRQPIRIWVPGCSTGEEAYTYSMLLAEVQERAGKTLPVQIFGTDVSELAIAIARNGTYSTSEVARLGRERIQRFFVATERGYVVKKSIRDACVFARQNLTKDSPFSKLDVVSCRNLLIYLGASLQKRLMPMFHYALRPGGYLVLGNSESVGQYAELFRLVDRRFRIYSRKATPRRVNFDIAFESVLQTANHPITSSPMPEETKETFDLMREADRLVLGRHAPPGVLVNEDMEILQFRGNVTPFISPAPGRASLSLTKMAREGLASEVQGAVLQAREENTRIRRTCVVRHETGDLRSLEIDVTPIDSPVARERFYLILFIAAEPRPTPTEGTDGNRETPPPGDDARIEQLKHDLGVTRSYLQTTIEKHEATNQELRAANEEIQSSNEELQSTNEELETAKEELQSTNEELTTVNEELHSRQLELIQLNNDLNNFINSVHLPIIILGQDMRIRRFTPMTERVLNIIPSDVGRPLSDLNLNLNIQELPRLMAEVMESLTIREMEVRDSHGRMYSLRLRPYKTADNKIDGVVMTLIDIGEVKRTFELEEARLFAEALVEAVNQPLLVVDHALHIRVANENFRRLFGTTREQLEGCLLFTITTQLWEVPGLRAALSDVLTAGRPVEDFAAEVMLPTKDRQRLLINARQVGGPARTFPWVLISFYPQPAGKP
jgi:two-component system, chemotaxis family, CheB/CheR fusion protein